MSVLPKQARLAKEELSTTHQGNNSRSIVTYAGAPVFNISNLNGDKPAYALL